MSFWSLSHGIPELLIQSIQIVLIVIIQIIHRIRVIVIKVIPVRQIVIFQCFGALFFQMFLLLQRTQAFLLLFEGLCLVQCGLNGIFFCLVEILSVPGHIYPVPQYNVFFRA